MPTFRMLALLLALLALTACDGTEPQVTVADRAPRPVVLDTEGGERFVEVYDFGENMVVLAHQRGGSGADWEEFARELVEAGYGAMVFDFAGYGGSEGERDEALDADLAAVVDYARSEFAQRIVVIGASMGGTAALATASALEVEAVAAVSAPATFGDLDAVADPAEVPTLLVAAEDDGQYAADAERLAEATGGEVVTYPGSAHGTDLVAEQPEVRERLIEFVESVTS